VPAVVAEGLRKSFGKTEALCGVDLEIERAQVLGLLGPNGAGKTTAVRILTTLLKPDAGRAVIDGVDVVSEPQRARARIGRSASPRCSGSSQCGGTATARVGDRRFLTRS
jgi:ABC-type multidrug transport system ATPase subunit